MELTHETLYLLALLDLRTERLFAECEPIVLDNANREAMEATADASAASGFRNGDHYS